MCARVCVCVCVCVCVGVCVCVCVCEGYNDIHVHMYCTYNMCKLCALVYPHSQAPLEMSLPSCIVGTSPLRLLTRLTQSSY